MLQFTDIFIARQPILDGRQRVFAYELLFRSSPENALSPGRNPELQTSHVIIDGMLADLTSLTDNKPAFLTFSREALVSDVAFALPQKGIVIEVPGTAVADADTLAA